MNIIGKNIRALRQKMNWTQGQVAQALDISIPAYSKLETGITDANFSRIQQMADFFSVDVSELIHEKGNVLEKERESVICNLKQELEEHKDRIIRLQKKVIELYEQMEEKAI